MQAAVQRAASQWSAQSMTPSTAADQVASALQQLQRDSQQQRLIVQHVKSIEAKLNTFEGSILTAGSSALALLLPCMHCTCMTKYLHLSKCKCCASFQQTLEASAQYVLMLMLQ